MVDEFCAASGVAVASAMIDTPVMTDFFMISPGYRLT
jgi:hypothetical protein